MYSNVLLVLVPLLLCLAVSSVNCDLEVQLLHVLFRHGDKVPHRAYQNYPTDPYRDYEFYPMGDGDLTNEGKMREYKIGKMLRNRYGGFFGEDYWPEKIYGLTTDIPRTQLSLQLVLAGLFPPSEKQTWNPHLPWIPAWTLPVTNDMHSLLFPHYCPRYQEEYGRFLALNNVKDIISKYNNVMSYLTSHTGKVVNTTGEVQYLYNLLKEEAAQNLTLPKWTENVYPNPMKDIVALDFHLRSYTKNLKRLNGGMLLRKIVDDIDTYKAGKLLPRDIKAFLFSGHETNVAALARTLGINDPVIPAYGSTIILETLRDKKGTYYVRVFHWTGVSEQLLIQTIPQCSDICPYDEFRRLLKDVIATDEERLCRRREHNVHHRTSSSTRITVNDFTLYLLTVAVLTMANTNGISKSFA